MGRLRSLLIPGVDKQLLVRDATRMMPDLARRRFIAGGASLGALTLLTGCDVTDSFSAESMLTRISKFNDAVQAAMFNPNALAPTFPESAITKPFPFNAYYALDDAPTIDGKEWKLEVRGLVDNKKSWTLEELYRLPQVKQVTRHICVEGWSAIGSWTGTPLRDFLKIIGADTRAKYCWFQCADVDGYNSPLDMASALHPQTQMTFKFGDEILPRAYGFPMKIRVPTKLGFKNPKYVISMEVTNDYKGGYWEDMGYNSFSGSYQRELIFLLPSLRAAAGRGRGWGSINDSTASEFAEAPPPPTPPHHAQGRVGGGEKSHAAEYLFAITPSNAIPNSAIDGACPVNSSKQSAA